LSTVRQGTRGEEEVSQDTLSYAERQQVRITALARRFPCLRSKFIHAESNGLEPWDVLRLEEVSRPWSSGEKLVVSFLAHVWGGEFATVDGIPPFDFFRAVNSLSKGNLDVLRSWLDDPFFC
jgi:hypothetical protein